MLSVSLHASGCLMARPSVRFWCLFQRVKTFSGERVLTVGNMSHQGVYMVLGRYVLSKQFGSEFYQIAPTGIIKKVFLGGRHRCRTALMKPSPCPLLLLLPPTVHVKKTFRLAWLEVRTGGTSSWSATANPAGRGIEGGGMVSSKGGETAGGGHEGALRVAAENTAPENRTGNGPPSDASVLAGGFAGERGEQGGGRSLAVGESGSVVMGTDIVEGLWHRMDQVERRMYKTIAERRLLLRSQEVG